MTGRTTHSTDHKPVLAGAGILHNSGGQHASLCFGTVVAKGGAAIWQRQVVVDGFGHMNVGNGIMLALEELGNAVCRRGRIVATYGDKQLDIVVGEQLKVETFLEILIGRFETAHFQY